MWTIKYESIVVGKNAPVHQMTAYESSLYVDKLKISHPSTPDVTAKTIGHEVVIRKPVSLQAHV